jgi:DNA-binding MarR family transcriptional regulator
LLRQKPPRNDIILLRIAACLAQFLTRVGLCARIQKMNAQQPAIIKNQEYELLEAIAQDPLVTQAGLSAQLGIAVGGVNWYIKRLVNCGYVKVSHLDRTRLKYHLTPEGVSALTQRTLLYMRKSLQVYNQLRSKARLIVAELKSQGIGQVCLDGNDEMMDILRLTCIENGLTPAPPPAEVLLKAVGQDFQIVYKSK